ncbi:MAG TPA: hypothetical protein VMS98_08770 [Thermoanaerobaculia bacterium]|nr:hypothetical protein [Thermoanaerobaculia bacterium]
MARYIKKFGRIGFALGPSEERGFAMWAGYDIVGVDEDLSRHGLIKVDDWSDQKLSEVGVTEFIRVGPDDRELYSKIGIGRGDEGRDETVPHHD